MGKIKNRAFDHSKYKDWINPEKVIPYQMNAKQHTEKQINNICTSIRRFGWQQDTVITSDNVLVIGHGRRLAALKIGCEMPYHVIDKKADELTDADIRELRIADNQTNAETGLDFDVLNVEVADLDFDGFDFDFAMDKGSDFFNREDRNDTSRQEGNDEYNEFLDKFEVKKTTDDCYTPEVVYEAIAEWVTNEYGIDRLRFVRPFYPGGDYKNYSYPVNCAVVDNPPFSILAEIISWYAERNIQFFLFAPQLTLFSSSSSSSCCCCLPCGVDITYENGAVVPTSFVTNLENNRIRVIPELYKVVEAANDKNLEATRRTLPKYKYPDYVLTAAMCNYMCAHDTPLTIKREDSKHIRYLDSQKEYGDKTIFGSGYLLSEKAAAEKAAAEKAAAEKAAAEKAAAEKAAAHVWELSEREWQIIKSLGHE